MAKKKATKAELRVISKMLGSYDDGNDAEVTVIKVGKQEAVDNKEMAERYKRSAQNLRRKVQDLESKNLQQKAQIKELQVKAYLKTDDALHKMVDKLNDDLAKLKKTNLEEREKDYQELLEARKLCNKLSIEKDDIEREKGVLTKDLEELVKYKKKSEEEIADLKKELKAWQDDADRFSNMDL
jgi:chromosome segregation ATPase